MAKFHDLCSLLGQLGMNGITEKSADKALRGFSLDKPNSDGVTLLAEMAWEGYPRAVTYLLSKGADPNKASGRWMKGPALVHAVTNNRSPARVKLQMVEILLKHEGIDLEAKVTEPEKKACTTLDYALDQALQESKVGKSYDADSQRHARGMLASYRQTIPVLVAAGATVSDGAKKLMKKLKLDEPAPTKAAAPRKDWAKKARAKLAKKGFDKRDDVFEICEILSRAASDKEWSTIVEAIIKAQPTFEAVAKDAYGEAVSFEDDEGWLCQGWDNYVLLDLVFELLAKEATLANPKWSKLVESALRAREKGHAVDETDSAVEELFASAWVKKHADFKKLRAIEKKTR